MLNIIIQGKMVADNNRLKSDTMKSRIPITLRIGVTGHRILDNEEQIISSVRNVLESLDAKLDRELPNSPHTFAVISPLAEGSDRLVAREVLNWKGADSQYSPYLEAVLPMPEDIYFKDFIKPGSIEEYYRLKAMAKTTTRLEYVGDRQEAFENAGKYVVHNCDILVAIWDGKPAAGRGGTADVIKNAEIIGRSMVIINSLSGDIKENTDWDKLIKRIVGRLQ